MREQQLTFEQIHEKLSDLFAIDEPSPVRLAYREAAAVLSTFRLERLQPVGYRTGAAAAAEFSADCEAARDEQGAPCWSLARDIRRKTLARLLAEQRLKEARSANVNAGPRQNILDAAIEAALDGKPPKPLPESLDVLRSLLVVSDWVQGVLPVQPAQAVRGEIQRLQLLDAFRELVGEHFAGRKKELETLADYVGAFGASSIGETLRRGVEFVFSIHDRPPLFIHGPGGIGKSTLIAKFVLDHARRAEEYERFPYAYLDFDRTALSPHEPITLLHEAIRQISLQYPRVSERGMELWLHWRQRFARRDSVRQSGSRHGRFRLENRDYYLESFAEFVNSLKMDDLPLLIVLDTFEEVQYRASSYVSNVFALLDQVQKRVPSTRTVVCGRDLPQVTVSGQNLKLRELELGEFDHDGAVGYLENRDVRPNEVARDIVYQVGCSPLVLRMAADLWKREGVSGKIKDLNTGFLARLRGKRVETQLYARFLEHIHEDDVRELAHPGLVLRKINAPLIFHVLAGPCKVKVANLGEAEALLNKLRGEFTLVTTDPSDPNSVIHRPDVRTLMLDDLRRDEQDRVKEIHRKAVKYYSKQTGREAWAETMYHRLSLGVDREDLQATDWTGLDELLPVTAIRELRDEAQAYLAARLPIGVDERVWETAAPQDWEAYIRRLISEAERTDDTSSVRRRIEAAPPGIPATSIQRVSALLQPDSGSALDGPARRRFADGLVDSFASSGRFESWLLAALARKVEERTRMSGSLRDMVFLLVTRANKEGWLDELVKAAVEEFPQHQAVYDAAQRLGLASLSNSAMQSALEAAVDEGPTFVDANLWREHLGQAERRVCRVESGPRMIGTGFLIGPGLVVFPAHMLPRDWSGDAAGLRFRFDYGVRKGGLLDAGQALRAAELTAWDREIDYVLVRLDDSVESRGWFEVSAKLPQPGDSLLALQHPRGGPLKLSFETKSVIRTDPETNQLIYRMSTEPGSGGAPCLDMDFQVVAMHQGRNPRFGVERGNCFAVLIRAVEESLQSKRISLEG